MAAAVLATVLLGGGVDGAGASARTSQTSESETAPAPLKIVVSLEAQQLKLYRGAELIDTSPISTGKRGHETPRGVYSILQKRRYHESNLYSNAPMPFMQRITWSGIAFHQGALPGYPASHGCIRMPRAFARKLFGMTALGANVAITDAPAALTAISHPVLTALHTPPTDAISTAEIRAQASARRAGRLRVLVTPLTARDRIRLAQRMLAALGYYKSAIDGLVGPRTMGAIAAFERKTSPDHQAGWTSTRTRATAVTPALLERLHAATGVPRQSGRVVARRGYRNIFETPAVIASPDQPLGTHVFTALTDPATADAAGEADARWTALTVDPADGVTARAALDRVTLPAAAQAQIAALLGPGATVIVSDSGASRETNRGTDFIVQP